MSPYPNAYQIEEIFSNRDNPTVFNTHLTENIDVTMVGQDFHLAGHHSSPQAFHNEVYGRITSALKPETLRIEVRRVIGGGDSAWAAVESSATAVTKMGELRQPVVGEGGRGPDQSLFFLTMSRRTGA